LLSIPVINAIIKKSIRKKLGLTRARIIFSGAAPISPTLLEWFKRLGINIQEAYGMTENLSYSHFNRPGSIRIGSVGQALPRCEVKISEQSEVLVKSGATMKGYFKDQEQTKEMITADGFLKTGDEGRIDDEGVLYITGRVKDIFKTSKGKYIAPAPIEKMIMSYELVSQVCVVGPGLPQPIALITIPVGNATDQQEKVIDHFKIILDECNKKLAIHEQLRKIVLFREEWTVGDILTPSLKIKRRSVEAIYGARFESWYEEAQDVIFGGGN
jgi:long-subunit acyl-CoA synthetase (AMP-forming)